MTMHPDHPLSKWYSTYTGTSRAFLCTEKGREGKEGESSVYLREYMKRIAPLSGLPTQREKRV